MKIDSFRQNKKICNTFSGFYAHNLLAQSVSRNKGLMLIKLQNNDIKDLFGKNPKNSNEKEKKKKIEKSTQKKKRKNLEK